VPPARCWAARAAPHRILRMASIYDFTVNTLDGAPQSLAEFRG
jgi:hypothetical protein